MLDVLGRLLRHLARRLLCGLLRLLGAGEARRGGAGAAPAHTVRRTKGVPKKGGFRRQREGLDM